MKIVNDKETKHNKRINKAINKLILFLKLLYSLIYEKKLVMHSTSHELC